MGIKDIALVNILQCHASEFGSRIGDVALWKEPNIELSAKVMKFTIFFNF